MPRIGAIQEDEGGDSNDSGAMSYLTNEAKQDILELPSFSSITNWTKELAGILLEFTFMNWLTYLVGLGDSKNLHVRMIVSQCS